MNKKIIEKLVFYVQKNKYKWYDPYDIKWTKYYNVLSRYNFLWKILYLLEYNFWFEIRKIFRIKKTLNNKALGLFIRSYCMMYNKTKNEKYLNYAINVYEILIKNGSKWYKWLCWWYPFDWQSKIFIPMWTPSIVVTSFCWQWILDLFEITKNEKYLNDAIQISKFILKDLNIFEKNNTICFSYTPIDNYQVHNANLLWANFLSRLSNITNNSELKKYAFKALNFTLNEQLNDWSFYYWSLEQEPRWSMIDNYHTWFVLECIYEIAINLWQLEEYKNKLKKWLEYYKNNLIYNDIPILTKDKALPINIHSISQSLITFSKLEKIENNKELLNKIFNFTQKNMYDKKRWYYYYKINKFNWLDKSNKSIGGKIKNLLLFNKVDKTPMMRWGLAWMLLALSNIYKEE